MQRRMSAATKLCLSCLLGVVPATWAVADSISIKAGSGNALVLDNVKVTGIQDGMVSFTTISGRQDSKDIKEVPVIKLDDEPAFSAAETAFDKGDWATAADNYRKAIQSSPRDWLKDRASQRLMEAASKSGNFGDAVAGFIVLLQNKPAVAGQYKPAIPKDHPETIDPAIAQVKAAAQDPKLANEQKAVLLNYLVELYGAKGDTASAAATLQQLAKIAPSDASSPEARRIQADVKLTEARTELAQRQYAQTVQTLETSGKLFGDPQQQAEALYLLAEAEAGAAKPGSSDQLKDAALAYMRVVANFKNVDGQPHVAESLLKTAAIEEKLKNTKEALTLYSQVAAEFKGSPIATEAQQNADRLGSAESPTR